MVEKRDRSTSDTAQIRRTGQTFDAFQAGDRRHGSESKQLLEAQLRATTEWLRLPIRRVEPQTGSGTSI